MAVEPVEKLRSHQATVVPPIVAPKRGAECLDEGHFGA
jgi:hypothetical protein